MPKGGAGRGQGRKELPPGEKKGVRVTVNLKDATTQTIDGLRGNKKRVAWIHEAIQEKIEREQHIQNGLPEGTE